MTLKQLYASFNSLRKSILKVKTENQRETNEKQQDEKAREIEKWLKEHPKDRPFKTMPYLTDPKFNAKIFQHSKFKIWNQPPSATQGEKEFIRTDSQNFVKTFIHPNSPYHSLLLWHGTGVGKTCSAIGIAEQYTEQLLSMNKKVWIVCPKALISTWYSEIFNVFVAVATETKSNSTMQKDATIFQCTGHKYTPIFKTLLEELDGDLVKIKKRIQAYIDKYYRIINYEKFVQVVENIRYNTQSGFEGDMIRQLKREFNHALLIIDEAHNLRKKKGNSSSTSVNALRSIRSIRVPRDTVVKVSDYRDSRKSISSKNIKRDATEICLGVKCSGAVRVNRVSGNGKIILYEKTKYAGRSVTIPQNVKSYVVPKVTKTITDILKYVTRHSDNLKLILLSATPMYDSHGEIVDLINMCRLNDKRPLWSHGQVFPSNQSLADTSHPLHEFTTGYISYVRGADPKTFPTVMYPPSTQTISLSTIKVFPSILTEAQSKSLKLKGSEAEIVPSKKMISTLIFPNGGYDNQAFHALFTSSTNTPPFKQPQGKSMFSKSTLPSYSPKYANLLKEINSCSGIVFVYTEYLITGAYTIAMMLEENGFTRYASPSFPRSSMLQNVSASGKRVSRKGSYVIFDESNATEISELLEAINSPNNKRGESVRVIIGTKRIEQGITFKNVRQIHILTPWWNMSRNKQIIGRGSRTLSHAFLPHQERNVTVFFHVGIFENGSVSPDVCTYEKALEKNSIIQDVEQVLRKNSIDCHTFSFNNQYSRKSTLSVIDSHSKKRTLTPIDIVTDSVQYTCAKQSDEALPFVMSAELRPKIKLLYRKLKKTLFTGKQYVLSENQMKINVKRVCDASRIPAELIPFALQYIIEADLPIFSGRNEGRLSFLNGYYTFIPTWMSTGNRRYLSLMYRTINPSNQVEYSNALRGQKAIMSQRISKDILKLSATLKKVSSHITEKYGGNEYTDEHLKLFTKHRQMMLLDEMDTMVRVELFHQWRNDQLDNITNSIVSDYFGTHENPSFVDDYISTIVLEGTTYYRIMNSDGEFSVYKKGQKKALTNRDSKVIRATFPAVTSFNLESVTAQYIGFRSYKRDGVQTVFKIVSDDSFSKYKKRKTGCRCKASGLGRKDVVVTLLKTLKKIFTGKSSTRTYNEIHLSSKRTLETRTVCEELELLFRSIKHKKVSFGSLRKYTITSI